MSPALRPELASAYGEKPRTIPHDSSKGGEPGSFLHAGTHRQRPSLSEFLEQLESVVNEKQDLACRLSKALDDIKAMNQLHARMQAEFDCERTRLTSEIADLRAQLIRLSNRSENGAVDDRRPQSLLAAREKLIRDEFERKFQELAVQVKRERNRYTQEVQKLKDNYRIAFAGFQENLFPELVTGMSNA